MLIEIHMIQNHSPSNLNRDDLGAPKTCIFGGVTRARISSQCLKRSIRRSCEFQAALEKDGGVRTRRLISILAEKASGQVPPDKNMLEFIAKAFEKGGVKRDPKDPNATKILLFLPNSTIDEMALAVKQARQDNVKAEQLTKALADILGRSAIVPDIALSGRMTELASQGLFAKMNLNVEAALSAAHAISTHEVVNEVDYWTAADDVPVSQGAAHVNEAMFASACFYKYFCLSWGQLVHNLAGRGSEAEAHKPERSEIKPQAERLAACTLGHFIRAAALTTPSGKQNSFAARNLPAGILVEIKKDEKVPTSYANAFAEPARKIGTPEDDAPDCVSLVGRSIAQFGDYVFSTRRAFGIHSTLLWFSPQLWRYPLRGWEREADGNRKEPPGPLTDNCYASLGGADNEPAGLVEAVIEQIGFSWADVKDAGRAQTQEA